MILLPAPFAVVLALAMHALHVTVERVFVLQELIADLAVVAVGVLVLPHVPLERRNFQIVSADLAPHSLDRLGRVHHREVNVEARHDLRAKVTNHRAVVRRIVAVLEVVQQLCVVLHRLLAHVALELARVVVDVIFHVRFERVLVAEEFTAVAAHHRGRYVHVEP